MDELEELLLLELELLFELEELLDLDELELLLLDELEELYELEELLLLELLEDKGIVLELELL